MEIKNEKWTEMEGHEIVHLAKLSSTNDFLEVLLNSRICQNGLVVIADHQTEGQGMRGNLWESEEGKNLTLSYLYYPKKLLVSKQFYISKVACLAVSSAIDGHMSGQTCKVKWPNDIYLNGGKVAGILIRNSVKGDHLQHIAIGIGLNVNQEHFSTETATSMKNESGNQFDKKLVLASLLRELKKGLAKLDSGEYESIDKAYYKKLIGFNTWLQYRLTKGEIAEGRITRIMINGHVQLEFRNGEKKEFDLKEISLVPAGQDGQPAY